MGELFPLFGTFERVFEGSSLSLFGVRVRVNGKESKRGTHKNDHTSP